MSKDGHDCCTIDAVTVMRTDHSPYVRRLSREFISLRRAFAQGLVEYGIIIAFVALLCVGSLLMFRPALPSLLSTLAGSV
jgi:hypothetical protein